MRDYKVDYYFPCNYHVLMQRGDFIATIKDIAKLAGVSQGTVSNVLSGRGNVSSEKIRRVQETAAALGHTVNEKARRLRKGNANILAVVLPNITHRPFTDFFLSFKNHAENCGYSVMLYTTGDDPQVELSVIQQLKAEMAAGVAVYTSFPGDENLYVEAGFSFENILFIERTPLFPCRYIGFDYAKCGHDLAKRVLADGHTAVMILTSSQGYSNELILLDAFCKRIESNGCDVEQIAITPHHSAQDIMALFSRWSAPHAVFLTRYGLSETVRDVWRNFYGDRDVGLPIYTISPIFTLPENDFVKYELNYRYMGKTAAEELVLHNRSDTEKKQIMLENYGFRKWSVPALTRGKRADRITVLTLDSPEAFAMQSLARRYTRETGVEVHVIVYSYDEIHEILSMFNESFKFDVLRLDVTLLSWFSRKVLRSLDEIDPDISSHIGRYIDGVLNSYSMIDGKLYALPSTPSVQLLYYRKDIFESTIHRRIFQETFKKELVPPSNFEEFNRIAHFFSKKHNASSPVEYGSSLTLGNSGVIGSEFLVRFFSYNGNLYDEAGTVRLDGYAGQKALDDLMELHKLLDGYSNKWWKDAAADFAAGKIAMSILYSNFASDILSHSSNVIKVGVAPVPGGSPLIGGGTLGVSRFSKYPEEALRFIQWMCSEPISSAATLLGGASACTKTYENYEIVDTYPWLDLARHSFAKNSGMRTPPEYTKPFNERQLLNIIAMGIRNTFNHTFSNREALNYMQNEFEKDFITQY